MASTLINSSTRSRGHEEMRGVVLLSSRLLAFVREGSTCRRAGLTRMLAQSDYDSEFRALRAIFQDRGSPREGESLR